MRTIDVKVYGTDTTGHPVKSVWTDFQVEYDEDDDGKIKGWFRGRDLQMDSLLSPPVSCTLQGSG